MVASNEQPSGSKPGPGTAHTHAPHEGPMPSSGWNDSDVYDNGVAVAPHGTPAPVGNNKPNPLH